MHQVGKVVAVDQQFVWIDMAKQKACDSCQAKAGCGKKMLDAVTTNHQVLKFPSPAFELAVGDQVELKIADQDLTLASLAVYFIPLLCLLVGASLGNYTAANDGAAIIGAAVGFLVGGVLIRYLDASLGVRMSGQLEINRISNTLETFVINPI